MSLLLVGISHHCAPLEVLERVSLTPEAATTLARRLLDTEHVAEAVVLTTCNRLEVYADVTAFHGGLADIGHGMAEATGSTLDGLTGYLDVRYAEHAVAHLFTVCAGLDSMALGEPQILGQVRSTLRRGQDDATVGAVLDPLLQRALRAGKRAHADTGLDHVAPSLVSAALEQVERDGVSIDGARAVVLGAGAMSSLAASLLRARGVAELTIVNRTAARARRLAGTLAAGWLSFDDDALLDAVGSADLVVSCTGAAGQVVPVELVHRSRERVSTAQQQTYLDLAMPRDIDPGVGDLPGVRLVDLAVLAEVATPSGEELDAARAVVAEEVEGYLATRRVDEVAPTVVALRSYAQAVAEAELERLRGRLGDQLDPAAAHEVARTVQRVVDKLLHTPTVRVKSQAADADGAALAAALRDLFDLEIDQVTGGAAITDVAGVLAAPVGRGQEAQR